MLYRSYSTLKESLVLEAEEDEDERLEETEALLRMAKAATFLWPSASFGLSVVERRTGALICGLLPLALRFMSSSDLSSVGHGILTTLHRVDSK